MRNVIIDMINQKNCRSVMDYTNTLKEIIQQIALLGLWRSKFFEHAAFYGGTALRILYGLDRFSEDLDFSLLSENPNFKLDSYNQAVQEELASFGFNSSVTVKEKKIRTAIQSAFIKTNTKEQLFTIEAARPLSAALHHQQTIHVKMEVDTNPPGEFKTEAKLILKPIPFSINTFTQPCLFSGKMHAILCRGWANRIKGRDWYDLIWYLSNKIPLNLNHLRARLIQSGHIKQDDILGEKEIRILITKKINETDFSLAKKDVSPFLTDISRLDIWSIPFFLELIKDLTIEIA